jgi:acetoacetyl-CoA synthetase
LKALGVEPGDRVAAYVPNVPEAIAAFLAVASLGAVWSSCSPDFGARSVVDRFAQIEPKVLLAVDGYGYGGKRFDRMEAVAGLQAEMPSLEHTVVLPYLDSEADLARLHGEVMTWAQLLETGADADGEIEFEAVPFDHPLWVLYSSGTTGLPKAIVQGQGGILLEHLKKLNLHVDAQAGDKLFWFTTTGWMMWNFLVSGLLTPATIILYDGSPGYPSLDVLWDLAADTGMTCFGPARATWLPA